MTAIRMQPEWSHHLSLCKWSPESGSVWKQQTSGRSPFELWPRWPANTEAWDDTPLACITAIRSPLPFIEVKKKCGWPGDYKRTIRIALRKLNLTRLVLLSSGQKTEVLTTPDTNNSLLSSLKSLLFTLSTSFTLPSLFPSCTRFTFLCLSLFIFSLQFPVSASHLSSIFFFD